MAKVERNEFHDGRVVLFSGDARDALKELPDNFLDSIVTDPPYALVSIVKRFGADNAAPAKSNGATGVYARASAGFMNAKWDTGKVAFDPAFWADALRVVKPGGHVAAFGGTRTYHRLACAIEDAGFDIRDALQWLYGCLSEDSEILTETGWKLGVDVCEGERIAAWDSSTGAITLCPVEARTIAPFSGDLVRFANDDTDQLLTPNHRVYYRNRRRKMTEGDRVGWYPAEYSVALAASVGRSNPIKLPMAGLHDGPGIGGTDYAALLAWVWTEGSFDLPPSTGVRVYQSESANLAKAEEIDALFSRILPERKRYDRTRPYAYKGVTRDCSETTWFFTGDLAQRVRGDLPGKRPTWSLLWRMSLDEKRAFLDAAMKGDGSGDDFYQKDTAALLWFQTLLALVGQRGKIAMRSAPRDGGGVCITPRDTTELQHRHLTAATHAPYTGRVWCVQVATGAFVARRCGKIFITGNSGFPKSHDVSKGIEKRRVEDLEPVRVICRAIRAAMDSKGLKSPDLTAHFGDCHPRLIDHWAARDTDSQPSLPTPEQWAKLGELLPLAAALDVEVARLNDRKGEFGAAYHERVITGEVEEWRDRSNYTIGGRDNLRRDIPATDAARQWAGWGTALKPACEIICLARKPLDSSPQRVTLTAEVLAIWEAKRCAHA